MEQYVVVALVDSSESHYQERIRIEGLRDLSNPFEVAEERFKKLFRLPKVAAIDLIDALDDPCLVRGFIPKHLKVLAALQFFAQGSYQTAVGQDNLLGQSQPTISRSLEIVANAIVTKLTPQHIKFPLSDNEVEVAKAEFQELFHIPNTIGAVDGTHVAIAKPPINHPTAPGNLFYNRKGFYSINCQIVCSARGKIIGLNPNFPGSTHDAAIWRCSKIHHYLRNLFVHGVRDMWLLGDKGYPLQPWLMTPVMQPTNAAEAAYNQCHAKSRNVVEMCNGRIKNKFRCLHRHRCLHYEPEKAAKIILSCCTLYNMFFEAFSDEDESIDSNSMDTEDVQIMEDYNFDFFAEAREIRQSLINNYFGVD